MLEHEKDYYTDRMRIEGNLTDTARAELYTKLDTVGFKDIEISVLNNSGSNIDSADIITRDTENPLLSIMELRIKATPKYAPFALGRLIGVTEEEGFYFLVKGKVLSEKPE